ncbi:MAG: replicative DNA helicase [Oligoflexales bacterium]|nr:replicative DNA helicase [Oligoflexales bacterium]
MKTNETVEQVAPHSAEAERAVLGAILRHPAQFHRVLDKVRLKKDHFFLDSHRAIFEGISELDAISKPIDVLTVLEVLSKKNLGSATPRFTYFIELIETCPVSENIEHYAFIIKEKFFLRKIIKTCQDTGQRAMSAQGEIKDFLETIEKEFAEINQDQDSGKGLVSARDVLIPTLEELEKRINSDGRLSGVSSGFTDLDKFTGGWQKSDLIILAARPGMGKTALGLNWALNPLHYSEDMKVAMFTLEMSKEQLVERLLSAEGRIDSMRLRKGDLAEDEQDRLMHAARSLNKLGVRMAIDETPGISLSELRARCRRYKREKGLDLIIIDYLQLMTGSQNAQKQGREREIGEISVGLKALAKELSVPVIALAQLNRGPDARPDKRPRMSDLRESGSMEQDADLIMFIYRDDYYNPSSEHAGKSEVIIAKNRHGQTGTVSLAWLPNFVSFHNLMKD